MPVFIYQGATAKGQRCTGELEASSRSEALRRLAADHIQPLKLTARGEVFTPGPASPQRRESKSAVRLSSNQVILFTDELADFLHSGLQLEPALQLIENREEASPLRTVAGFLREKVRDGTSFSDALKLASPSFGELYGNLVAAGEVSGALGPILRRQSRHLIAMQELRSRIQLALIYPAFLVLAGLVAMIVFMTVLVPQMTSLFAKTGSVMPLPTYLLIKASHATQHYGLIVLGGVFILAVVFAFYRQQPAGRRWWDETKLKLPLVGPLLRANFHAQFCQTMANLLQNGLPLLTALKLMSRATGNVFLRTIIERVTERVGEGASLTRSMKTVGQFPANLRDLVKVGEQTGDLGTTLEKVGQRYEKIIQQRIDQIMSLVPLVIIVALGLMVLLIAWSMMSGIFQAIHGLQGHR